MFVYVYLLVNGEENKNNNNTNNDNMRQYDNILYQYHRASLLLLESNEIKYE